MNYNRVIKKGLYVAFLSLSTLSMISCEETIDMNSNDDRNLGSVEGVYVSLHNDNESRLYENINVYLTEVGEAEVSLRLTRKADQIINFKLVYDKTLVDQYNTANGTDFESYPAELLSFENEGIISIVPGDVASESLNIVINHNTAVSLMDEVGKSYMLPIAVESTTEGVEVMANKASYLFIVKPQGERPNSAKDSADPEKDGVAVNMYFEVNDTNILNAGEWTMAESGKPLADIVCIFAANINYNAEEGRVFLNLNENVSHILNNRDKYIKPLQDMGIKVTMAILGNHDAAALTNLSPETCIVFAKQLKECVDAYGLDGIEFDDEYSKPELGNGIPGFVPASREAFVNLVYETRRIMPDKIIGMYHYGAAGGGAWNKPFRGINPSELFDYTYEAYYSRFNTDIQDVYLGCSKMQVSPYSRKISGGMGFDDSDMAAVRDEYGCQMIYNYQINRASSYVSPMNRMCNILFDEDVVYGGVEHPKDY